jgi:phosphoribosylamine-glycine ligase
MNVLLLGSGGREHALALKIFLLHQAMQAHHNAAAICLLV